MVFIQICPLLYRPEDPRGREKQEEDIKGVKRLIELCESLEEKQGFSLATPKNYLRDLVHIHRVGRGIRE